MPQQSNTAALMHLSMFQKYQIFSSLAHKSNMHKHTVSQPKLSPNDASFKSFLYQRAQHLDCHSVLSLYITTSIGEDASHPKKAIQSHAEIPTAAVH